MSENLNVYRIPVSTVFSMSFDGFHGKVAYSRSAGETVYEHHLDAHRIFITLDGQTSETIAEVEQLPTVRRPDRPGVVTVVPAGVRRSVLLRDADFLILGMTVTDSFLQLCTEGDAGRASEAPPIVQNVHNEWLLRAAQTFHAAGMSNAPAMQMQTLAFAMVRHLARSPGRISENGGLDPVALVRVLELMHDRLADDLTLTELAAEAGLGVSAFGRAFAKSIGTSPYRYFAALRMQRATELLLYSQHSLAEIAGEIGYADQAHFTAAFTRHSGISPGKWRAEFGTIPQFLPISRKTSDRSAV
ncbi:MAG: helix-turn-helix domain-containing protein [Rhodomicrobiaceae bacterium]